MQLGVGPFSAPPDSSSDMALRRFTCFRSLEMTRTEVILLAVIAFLAIGWTVFHHSRGTLYPSGSLFPSCTERMTAAMLSNGDAYWNLGNGHGQPIGRVVALARLACREIDGVE